MTAGQDITTTKTTLTIEEVCDFVEWMNLHYRALEHTIIAKDARGTRQLLEMYLSK